jgi:hypothetical protein
MNAAAAARTETSWSTLSASITRATSMTVSYEAPSAPILSSQTRSTASAAKASTPASASMMAATMADMRGERKPPPGAGGTYTGASNEAGPAPAGGRKPPGGSSGRGSADPPAYRSCQRCASIAA